MINYMVYTFHGEGWIEKEKLTGRKSFAYEASCSMVFRPRANQVTISLKRKKRNRFESKISEYISCSEGKCFLWNQYFNHKWWLCAPGYNVKYISYWEIMVTKIWKEQEEVVSGLNFHLSQYLYLPALATPDYGPDSLPVLLLSPWLYPVVLLCTL